MSAYALRCRVCEDVTAAEPADSRRRGAGPTDVLYDWARIERTITRGDVARGPASLWRYATLLPVVARVDVGAGWTPLVRSDLLSDALDVEVLLKLEVENPTAS